MKLEQSFEVAAPIERVWSALNDLEQVAPCLPGAAITGRDDDGTYRGEFTVKLGPTTANYRGTIRIESADEATHTATLAAKGSDKRGQGGATATIVNTLAATDAGGTRVDAVTDFSITGRLASFGRGGMIKDISNRLLSQFSDCLQQRLSGEPEPATATVAAGGMTAEDAAASAGAETRPEESATAAPERGEAAGDREVRLRVHARAARVRRAQRVDDRRRGAALAALVRALRRERGAVGRLVHLLDADRAAVGGRRRAELDLEGAVIGAVLVVAGDRRAGQARRDLLEVDQRLPDRFHRRRHLERVLELHRCPTSRSSRVSMSRQSPRCPHSTAGTAESRSRKPASPRSSPARASSSGPSTTG